MSPEFQKSVKDTELAIESGRIGEAHQHFERCYQMCLANNVDPETQTDLNRLATGFVLMNQCELETIIENLNK